jgi:PhoH-like ATPase
MHVEDIFESIIEITALSYIRGRTLRNTYVICDEAQNASRSLIKDLITRAGNGTKIVLCGDPDQVDAPNLDAKNNGLIYAVDKMKESPLSAIVKFDANKSVRSPLAKDAIQRM